MFQKNGGYALTSLRMLVDFVRLERKAVSWTSSYSCWQCDEIFKSDSATPRNSLCQIHLGNACSLMPEETLPVPRASEEYLDLSSLFLLEYLRRVSVWQMGVLTSHYISDVLDEQQNTLV